MLRKKIAQKKLCEREKLMLAHPYIHILHGFYKKSDLDTFISNKSAKTEPLCLDLVSFVVLIEFSPRFTKCMAISSK